MNDDSSLVTVLPGQIWSYKRVQNFLVWYIDETSRAWVVSEDNECGKRFPLHLNPDGTILNPSVWDLVKDVM